MSGLTPGTAAGVAAGGIIIADDGSVWPSQDQVLEGVEYGPNGNDYTGTLGTASSVTQSVFDAAYVLGARPSLMQWHGQSGTYTPRSTGVDRTISGRWIQRSSEAMADDGFGIDVIGGAHWYIYDDNTNGVAAPSIGDTVTMDSVTYAVKSWDRGPGEWKLVLLRKDPYQMGGGVRHARSR